jgi:class 3 adenylate cyclase
MDLTDLAAASGVPAERIEAMTALGLLRVSDEGYVASDIQLARVLEALDASGISVELIGEMAEAGEYSTTWAADIWADPVRMSGHTLTEVVTDLDIDLSLATGIFTAYRLPVPSLDDELRVDEVEMLELAAAPWHAAGRPDAISDNIIAMMSPMGEALRRVAASQMQLFRATFEEPILASGMPVPEALDLIGELGKASLPMALRTVGIVHQRHIEALQIAEIVENTERAMALAGRARRHAPTPQAVAFLDLSDSTGYTESEGDEEAARLAAQLAGIVHQATEARGGRLVKLLGDGAMVHFPDPSTAVPASLDIVDAAAAAGLPPARVGAHAGQMVAREGDLFGRTVIVAARMNDYARPREVLVTSELAALTPADAARFEPIGPVTLKGLTEPVSLVQARRA